MKSAITPTGISFSGQLRDLRGLWLRLYDAYGTMPLGEYIRLCMDEKGIA